jgi:hypothetical protein
LSIGAARVATMVLHMSGRFTTPWVVAMESLEYISKAGKETIMSWYWIPPFSYFCFFLLSVSLKLDPLFFVLASGYGHAWA